MLVIDKPEINSGQTKPPPEKTVLSVQGVSKRFAAIQALTSVSLDVYPGEVHVIMGENGAGKSTLINILGGTLSPDEGQIAIDGEVVHLVNPARSRALGIAVIHQELTGVPYLSVIENISLGNEPKGVFPGFVNRGKEARTAGKILESLGFTDDPGMPLCKLTTGKQQVVEIAKALSQGARIVIMDEPTASLSERECDRLYEIIDELKSRGVAIIFISHRMKEVFQIADRITVLRDGRYIMSAKIDDVTQEQIIRSMVGREVDAFFSRNVRNEPGEVLLRTKDLCSTNGIKNVNIKVHRAEVVGIAGLVGSGRTEVARAIFGADPISSGDVELKGEPYTPDPVNSVRKGIAFVPEDRKMQGLVIEGSIKENLSLPSLWKFFPRGFKSSAEIEVMANAIVRKLSVAAHSINQSVRTLSGGNQQKIAVGKWLPLGSDLIIIDEPTRGVDVGAKSEILNIIENLTITGSGVLMISSELPEIVSFCDRVYVMRGGEIVGHLNQEELSEESIMKLAVSDD